MELLGLLWEVVSERNMVQAIRPPNDIFPFDFVLASLGGSDRQALAQRSDAVVVTHMALPSIEV